MLTLLTRFVRARVLFTGVEVCQHCRATLWIYPQVQSATEKIIVVLLNGYSSQNNLKSVQK